MTFWFCLGIGLASLANNSEHFNQLLSDFKHLVVEDKSEESELAPKSFQPAKRQRNTSSIRRVIGYSR